MSRNEGGPTPEPGDPSERTKDEQAGLASDSAPEDGEPSPDERERGEASFSDDRAIDLDSAHDRAS